MLEQTASCSDNCGSTCKKPACENSIHTHIHGSTSWVLHVACVVCVRVYMSVLCKCVCTHTHVPTCTHTYTYTYTPCVGMCICVSVVCVMYMCVCMWRVYTHTHIPTCTYTRLWACVCAYSSLCVWCVCVCMCVCARVTRIHTHTPCTCVNTLSCVTVSPQELHEDCISYCSCRCLYYFVILSLYAGWQN